MDLDNFEDLDDWNYRKFFPYDEFRQDQEATIVGIDKCIKKNGNFILIAPNGTGKTITSLCGVFPLAYSVLENVNRKIISSMFVKIGDLDIMK